METMSQEYMTIHAPCHMCGEIYPIRVKSADYREWTTGTNRHVQDVFPYLKAWEREMFLTRTCDECWKRMFGDED